MLPLEVMKELARPTPSKIVLLVIDGLGGLPGEGGATELESARTPNLDLLASQGICGLIDPVSPGITPGSAPGHLALFGYDPVRYLIRRGVLEAAGIEFDLQRNDLAARGNFCTIDGQGLVVDRRAGRISTEKCAELCRLLNGIEVDGTRVLVEPVREHRFVAVFRGEGLGEELTDSDPQQLGVPPRLVAALSPDSERAARLVNDYVAQARAKLAGHAPANMVLLRGFSRLPHLPPMAEAYRLNPAAIAAYPMYRGLAKLLGMKVLPTGSTIEEEFATLAQHYKEHDFFFVHIKKTDAAGEDGDFAAKVAALEEIDSLIPRLTELEPDVLVVTGDHSTPAALKGHSWHPVPLVLCSKWCRPDRVRQFTEGACAGGALGRFPATEVMALALSNALKLEKFGA